MATAWSHIVDCSNVEVVRWNSPNELSTMLFLCVCVCVGALLLQSYAVIYLNQFQLQFHLLECDHYTFSLELYGFEKETPKKTE